VLLAEAGVAYTTPFFFAFFFAGTLPEVAGAFFLDVVVLRAIRFVNI
jgi:hypothetical protein